MTEHTPIEATLTLRNESHEVEFSREVELDEIPRPGQRLYGFAGRSVLVVITANLGPDMRYDVEVTVSIMDSVPVRAYQSMLDKHGWRRPETEESMAATQVAPVARDLMQDARDMLHKRRAAAGVVIQATVPVGELSRADVQDTDDLGEAPPAAALGHGSLAS